MKDNNITSPVSGFLRLPVELLLEIVDDAFNPHDPIIIYHLSQLCKRLQFQLLPVYLARARVIEYTTESITLVLKESTLDFLPVLHRSGLLTSIDHLRCSTHMDALGKFSPSRYINQLRAIQKFMPSLRKPNNISIDFTGVEFWLADPSSEMTALGLRCTDAMSAMLRAVADTTCKSLTMTSGVHPFQTRWPTSFASFETMKWNGGNDSHDVPAAAAKRSHLRTLNLHSVMFFEPPTIESTRILLSLTSVTHLSLGYLRLNPEFQSKRSNLLLTLTIRSLTHLSLTHIDAPWGDISALLSRHPSIIMLRLGEALSIPLKSPAYTYAPGILPNVKHLLVTPTHLPWAVTLITTSSSPIYPQELCLMTTMSRANPLTKTINFLYQEFQVTSPVDITTDLYLYLNIDDHTMPLPLLSPPSPECMATLQVVSKIEIATAWKTISRFVDIMPVWLRNFPRLQEVVMPVEHRPSLTPTQRTKLIVAMKRQCPSIQKIQLHNEEFLFPAL